MFGMMEAVLSFIRRQVGLRTDGASASGSLHAKANAILNKSVIKSIQRGVLTIDSYAKSKTATISAVTTGKTMVSLLGFTTNASTAGPRECSPRIELTNSTTITASVYTEGSLVEVGWEAIEFY